MKSYQELIERVLSEGIEVPNRTGVNTLSVHGSHQRFKLQDGFPILTTRYQPFDAIAHELLWFFKGTGDISYLIENKVNIWNLWAMNNSIGPLYPEQMTDIILYRTGDDEKTTEYLKSKGYERRKYLNSDNEVKTPDDGIFAKRLNQLEEVIESIKTNPFSRRHIISYWNPAYLPDESLSPQENVAVGNMALAPCHAFLQFMVKPISTAEALRHRDNHEGLRKIIDYFASKGVNILQYGHGPVGEVSLEELNDLSESRLNNVLNDIALAVDNTPEIENIIGKPLKRHSLSLSMYQRSWDIGAAYGFNISQYSLLLEIVARLTNTIADELIHTAGDVHIYVNQIPMMKETCERRVYVPPTLVIKDRGQKKPQDFVIDDFELEDYCHGEKLYIPVAK